MVLQAVLHASIAVLHVGTELALVVQAGWGAGRGGRGGGGKEGVSEGGKC